MGLAARIRLPNSGRLTLPFLLLILCTLLVYMGAGVMVVQLLGQQILMSKHAFETGQSLRLLIEEQRVEGNMLVIEPAPPPAVEPAPAIPGIPASPTGAPPAPVSTKNPAADPATPAQAPVATVPVTAPVVHLVTQPLNPAPNAELEDVAQKDEKTGKMLPVLPKISEDGKEAWSYYGKAVPAKLEGARIAVMLTGLGINATYTQNALNLPEYVSLSFSPYAPNLTTQVERARKAGHEVWLDLPMEPEDYPASDPGPYAMLKTLANKDLLERLHALMGLAPGIVGFIAPERENFSGTPQMAMIAKDIAKRGMLLAMRNRNFVSAEIESHLIYSSRELDASRHSNAPLPDQLLVELEAVAKGGGSALAVMDYAPAVVAMLPEWIAGLKSDDVTLVAATAAHDQKKK